MTAASSDDRAPAAIAGFSKPSWRFLFALTGVLFTLFLLLCWPAFDVLPVGDDFTGPLLGLHQGNADGPLSFFTANNQAKNYRPLQQLTMWLVAGSAIDSPFHRIIVLNFVSFAFYAMVLLAWLREAPLNRLGVTIALVVFLFHPAQTGVIAGIDNFSVFPSVAFTWLGAWCVYIWRDHLGRALVPATACLVIGALYKEYTFGLVPLAALVLLVFRTRHKWRGIFLCGLVLGSAGVALLLVRKLGMPVGVEAAIPRPELNPVPFFKNMAMYGAVLTFFGDTTWVFVQRNAAMIGLAGLSAAVTIGLLATGVIAWLRGPRMVARRSDGSSPEEGGDRVRWVVFLGLSIFCATFPNNVATRVSEIYAPAAIPCLAILAGLAAIGIAGGSRVVRVVATVLCVAQLGLGVGAIRSKIAGSNETGRRTARLVDALLEALPAEIDGKHIAFLYLDEQVHRERYYSIFKSREQGLVHTTGFLDFYRPEVSVTGETLVVSSPDDVDLSPFDIAVLWDMDRGEVIHVK